MGLFGLHWHSRRHRKRAAPPAVVVPARARVPAPAASAGRCFVYRPTFDVWTCIFDRMKAVDIVRFGATCKGARASVERYAQHAYGPHLLHCANLEGYRATFDKWRFETFFGLPRPRAVALDPGAARRQVKRVSESPSLPHWTDPARCGLLLATYLPSGMLDPHLLAGLLDDTWRPMEAEVCRRAARGSAELLEGLCQAMQQGRCAAIRYALSAGVDPDTPGKLGRTRLLYAAEAGDVDAVYVLLAAGARIMPPGTGISALHLARDAVTRRALGDSTAV